MSTRKYVGRDGYKDVTLDSLMSDGRAGKPKLTEWTATYDRAMDAIFFLRAHGFISFDRYCNMRDLAERKYLESDTDKVDRTAAGDR